MKVFIAGIDGYLGWALAQYLVKRGHEIAGCDLFLRRKWVQEMGSQSATPISNALKHSRKRTVKTSYSEKATSGNTISYCIS
jgi:nucleoside-diphosphate-sugar epimerase